MKEQLDRIEARLQNLIENSLSALVPWGNARQSLVHELVTAMHSNLITSADGRFYAPNVYTLQIHPDRLPYWQADPGIIQDVAGYLSQAAYEAGIHFLTPPVIHLAANPTISLQDVSVIPSIEQDVVGNTSVMLTTPPPVETVEEEASIPPNAFLIVNGNETVPLNQAVVNLGRRLDNHVVIDDPRVSRAHAQLRAIHGKYVLFDLNSTGGTYVNGQRISRYDLNPGDVISLSGVPLIYGQDATAPGLKPSNPNPREPSGSTKSFPTRIPDRSHPNPHT